MEAPCQMNVRLGGGGSPPDWMTENPRTKTRHTVHPKVLDWTTESSNQRWSAPQKFPNKLSKRRNERRKERRDDNKFSTNDSELGCGGDWGGGDIFCFHLDGMDDRQAGEGVESS